MIYLISLFVFFFGIIIGSFLNVVILRYNTGASISKDRSRCFSCGKTLRWYELIPIFSFLIQGGKCRGCKSKISWQYIFVEIITGAVFLLIFAKVGGFLNNESGIMNNDFNSLLTTHYSLLTFLKTGYYLIIFSLLIIIAVYDFRHQIIPDLFVWLFNGFAFLFLFSDLNLDIKGFNFIRILDLGLRILSSPAFLTGLAMFAFFGALWFFSRGTAMGFGDAKLALGIGWLLGMEKGITALFLSFWLGAIVSIFLLFLKRGGYTMKSKIAFGPFLILAVALVFFTSFDLFALTGFGNF